MSLQVLKEQARRYKHRLQDAERHESMLEQQLLAAQASNSKLKAQLQEGDTADQSAVELAQARQQAEGLNRALEVRRRDESAHTHTDVMACWACSSDAFAYKAFVCLARGWTYSQCWLCMLVVWGSLTALFCGPAAVWCMCVVSGVTTEAAACPPGPAAEVRHGWPPAQAGIGHSRQGEAAAGAAGGWVHAAAQQQQYRGCSVHACMPASCSAVTAPA